jgi:hypothetical protein|eukprot:SAG25_NODE_500_length_7380_cov_16.363137_6_plen_77_part_00
MSGPCSVRATRGANQKLLRLRLTDVPSSAFLVTKRVIASVLSICTVGTKPLHWTCSFLQRTVSKPPTMSSNTAAVC